jgi:hypothetical protein
MTAKPNDHAREIRAFLAAVCSRDPGEGRILAWRDWRVAVGLSLAVAGCASETTDGEDGGGSAGTGGHPAANGGSAGAGGASSTGGINPAGGSLLGSGGMMVRYGVPMT